MALKEYVKLDKKRHDKKQEVQRRKAARKGTDNQLSPQSQQTDASSQLSSFDS